MSVIESEATLAERSASFAVPAVPAAVGRARANAVGVLLAWAAPVDYDIAELLLSEVVTNAVLHGFGGPEPSGRVEIDLTLTPARLRVAVHDPDLGGGRAVGVQHPDTDSENGHGLELVEALAVSWGCEATVGGKIVYFELRSSELSDTCRSADGTGAALAVAGR